MNEQAIREKFIAAGVEITDEQLQALSRIANKSICPPPGDLIDAVISLATSPNVDRIKKLRFLPVARL